jgi:xylulose-5-phosphate/fructose-6-phosphate phosphoketolase
MTQSEHSESTENLLSTKQVKALNAYWKAANYISVGQIYLKENALLKEPLSINHIKPRLLGHWGTTPGLNLIYVHLNRLIINQNLNIICITGPGHGAPGIIANTYLEGSYTKFYPQITQDELGLTKLFKQFSFPGGIPSHTAAETPGSIHEGGELGYSLAHAYGAVFDNPSLIAACVVGDGEAETGPLATAWHSNKFLNPQTDGAVLPILHLNGYKIANPTLLARIPSNELIDLFKGYGYQPIIVESSDPQKVHQLLADAMETAVKIIHEIQNNARFNKQLTRPVWPMIILKTPKGWTGPRYVLGKPVENSWRSHQVPIKDFKEHPEFIEILKEWLCGYDPDSIFKKEGGFNDEIKSLIPQKSLSMGQNPHANGGLLLQKLILPDLNNFSVEVTARGVQKISATSTLGKFLSQVMAYNMQNFRVFGPDETASNRLNDLYTVTSKTWLAEKLDTDEDLEKDGRVMEILSEHTCQGWFEGYLLTGRHGFFSCYEAFINIVASMFSQYAKWLKVSSKQVAWRKPVASLNYLLTSHVWRQDHNGFSHQDPGFIDHVSNKDADIVRVYFPPDANTLLHVGKKVLQSYNKVNVIVAGKQPQYQWLNHQEALEHCQQGLGVWNWASNDGGQTPDLIMAACGDVPTIEALAAVKILNELVQGIKIKFINVVNLFSLKSAEDHPQGISDKVFNKMFTPSVPIIFAYHGYPSLIHELVYKRTCHSNMHVHGFCEQGTTTTPFDMLVMNKLDRFNLVKNAVNRVDSMKNLHSINSAMDDALKRHKEYIVKVGDDLPEIINWKWSS